MMKRMLVAKEVRKDLAAAQRELEEALASDEIQILRSCIRLAKVHITDAMKRLA
jgi:hypothetical protein